MEQEPSPGSPSSVHTTTSDYVVVTAEPPEHNMNQFLESDSDEEDESAFRDVKDAKPVILSSPGNAYTRFMTGASTSQKGGEMMVLSDVLTSKSDGETLPTMSHQKSEQISSSLMIDPPSTTYTRNFVTKKQTSSSHPVQALISPPAHNLNRFLESDSDSETDEKTSPKSPAKFRTYSHHILSDTPASTFSRQTDTKQDIGSLNKTTRSPTTVPSANKLDRFLDSELDGDNNSDNSSLIDDDLSILMKVNGLSEKCSVQGRSNVSVPPLTGQNSMFRTVESYDSIPPVGSNTLRIRSCSDDDDDIDSDELEDDVGSLNRSSLSGSFRNARTIEGNLQNRSLSRKNTGQYVSMRDLSRKPSSLPRTRAQEGVVDMDLVKGEHEDDEALDNEDIEAMFPATVGADGKVLVQGKRVMRLTKDCGMYKEKPHLSLRLARAEAAKEHPRYKSPVTGKYVPFPLDAQLGTFPWPWEEKGKPSALSEYGLGLVFYFKMLKSLAVLFAIISAVTIPSLGLYIASKARTNAESNYQIITHSERLLGAKMTVAALGERQPSCRQTYEGDSFGFSCPLDQKINSVIAYYGQPRGACGCPPLQQQVTFGVCQGAKSNGVCTTKNMINNKAVTVPCFAGYNRYQDSCCTTQLSNNGNPDFSSLSITPNTACNSLTAPYIVNAFCEGKISCNIPISKKHVFSIPTSAISTLLPVSGTVKITDICQTQYLVQNIPYCNTTFAYNGNFANCSQGVGVGINGYTFDNLGIVKSNLLFEAVCITDTIQLGQSSKGNNDQSSEKKSTIVSIAATLDAISILLFFLGISWIRYQIEKETLAADKDQCTASDYTVQCLTMPKGKIDEKHVKTILHYHLETVLNENRRLPQNRIDGLDEEDIRIADINCSTGCSAYLEAAVLRGNASNLVDKIISKIRIHISEERVRKSIIHTHVENHTHTIDDLHHSIRSHLKIALYKFEYYNDLCLRLSDTAKNNIHSAFITFANEYSYISCLKQIPNIGIWTRLTQEKKYRMKSRPVYITKCTDPDDIIWENLPLPVWSQILRVICTTALTVFILAISYVMIYEAYYLRTQVSSLNPSIVCGTYEVLLSQDIGLMQLANDNTITYQKVLYDVSPESYPDVTANTAYGSYNYLQCYCAAIVNQNLVNGFQKYEFYDKATDSNKQYCSLQSAKSFYANAVTYASTAIIIIVNQILILALRKFVLFEKLSSQTAQLISLTFKLFIAQYVNTALLTLIINGNLNLIGANNFIFASNEYFKFGFFTGEVYDYNVRWYENVGSAITFTMCLFTIGEQPMTYFRFFSERFLRIWDRRWSFKKTISHKENQMDLNELYLGPKLQIETKYAAILTLIFVDMTYSSSMPFFNVITAVNLGIIFATDKYMMLRYYRKPSSVSTALPRMVIKTLYAAALIHVAQGVWMLGSRVYKDPYAAVITKYAVDRIITPAGRTIDFLLTQHTWEPPIIAAERINNPNILFLLVLFIILAIIVGTNLIIMQGEFLGINDVIRIFWKPTIVVEGNPTYINAMSNKTLIDRIATGTLTVEMEDKYRERCFDLGIDPDGLFDQINNDTAVQSSPTHPIEAKYRTIKEVSNIKSSLKEMSKEDAAGKVILIDKNNNIKNDKNGVSRDSSLGDLEIGNIAATSDDKMVTANNSKNDENNDLKKDDGDKDDDKKDDKKNMYCGGCCANAKCCDVQFEVENDTKREIIGHESFNMNTNEEYRSKFGLNSEHIRRVHPKDWIVQSANLSEVESERDNIIQVQIHQILAESRPKRNMQGEVISPSFFVWIE